MVFPCDIERYDKTLSLWAQCWEEVEVKYEIA